MRLFKRRNSGTQRTDQIAVPTPGDALRESEKLPRLSEGSHVGMLVLQLAPTTEDSSSDEAMDFMAGVESALTGWPQTCNLPEGWAGKLSFLMPNGPADCGLTPVDITCAEPSWEVSKHSN